VGRHTQDTLMVRLVPSDECVVVRMGDVEQLDDRDVMLRNIRLKEEEKDHKKEQKEQERMKRKKDQEGNHKRKRLDEDAVVSGKSKKKQIKFFSSFLFGERLVALFGYSSENHKQEARRR